MNSTKMINFYNIDNMEFMKSKPDNYYDLAIVDPPYGINMSKNKTIGKRKHSSTYTIYKQSNWDSEIPHGFYFLELMRISQNQIIFGGNYFTNHLPPSQGWFIYDKRKPENFSMAHAELAFTSFDRSARMFGVKRSDSQNCVSNNKQLALANAKIHQCQKPITLYRWLLKNYAKPGDKILDTHGGSGSIAIACDMEGFDLDICEIDKEYFEASKKRFEIYKSQTVLF